MIKIINVGDNQLPVLLAEIERNVGTYRKALIKAERANRTAQHLALVSIYELHVWFIEHESVRNDFYNEYDIRIDPRSRYPALPLVKHFMAAGDPCPELQTRASYWSGAIHAGVLKEINADEFISFIDATAGGIHGAYKIAVDWDKSKPERIARAMTAIEALSQFQAEFQPDIIPTSKHTEHLTEGRHLAVIERDDQGRTYLTATVPDSKAQADKIVQQRAESFVKSGKPLTNKPTRPNARRRYNNAIKRVNPIVLKDDHQSIIDGTTRHSHLVRKPNPGEMILKSGEHSRKLGSVVEKGKWKGFPIFSLSLEERKTCPRSCSVWDRCYGNGMGQAAAFRYQHGPALIHALQNELTILSSEKSTKNGFVVRLHTLGDFYSVDYVDHWREWLNEFPALCVFGFTARLPGTEIGDALIGLRNEQWDRFAIRSSDAPDQQYGASVIPSSEESTWRGSGIICPAETGVTNCCGSCGYCWHSVDSVTFIEH